MSRANFLSINPDEKRAIFSGLSYLSCNDAFFVIDDKRSIKRGTAEYKRRERRMRVCDKRLRE